MRWDAVILALLIRLNKSTPIVYHPPPEDGDLKALQQGALSAAPKGVAGAVEYLCDKAGDEFLGKDFSLKDKETRKQIGLQ